MEKIAVRCQPKNVSVDSAHKTL